mgnify:CR=1 FL=1|tara:strand:- start:1217 stop:1435 length:219 start_codon:yes stop_codon:yes gene_type:complete
MNYLLSLFAYLVVFFAGGYAHQNDLVRQCEEGGSMTPWLGEEIRCAPIVKVSTMEEARKQIEINKVMTGVKG